VCPADSPNLPHSRRLFVVAAIDITPLDSPGRAAGPAFDPWSGAVLYGILDTGYLALEDFSSAARELIAGGVGILQVRAKRESAAIIEALAREVHPFARSAGVPLILNDFAEIAAAVGCEGVHVGQEDDSVARARAIVGPGKIVGKSTHSVAQAVAAQDEGADYIGFGPLFATPTKPGRAAIGLTGIAEVHRLVTVPIFCIGGIKRGNLQEVRAAGARRVVIVSEMLGSSDRSGYAAAVKGMWSAAGHGQ
jgi:thiamine-phosphate pyrophosphorylase